MVNEFNSINREWSTEDQAKVAADAKALVRMVNGLHSEPEERIVILAWLALRFELWRLESFHSEMVGSEAGIQETLTRFLKLADFVPPVREKLLEFFQGHFGYFVVSLEEIAKIDFKWLGERFPEFFDHVLDGVLAGIFKGGFSLQSESLSKFMLWLGKDSLPGTIYNPFAGLASYAIFMPNGSKYYGQEINSTIQLLAELRMIAYQADHENIQYILESSISEWCPLTEKPDLIISNPPFGLKVLEIEPAEVHEHKKRSLEYYFIPEALATVAPNGRIVLAVASGFLASSRSTDSNIRKRLVVEDVLETVIEMPGGLIKNTGVRFSILVINCGKLKDGRVLFVDGTEFAEGRFLGERVLDANGLMDLISGRCNTTYLREVPNSEIREADWSLLPRRYISQPELDATVVELGDFCKLVGTRLISGNYTGPFIRAKNLTQDESNFLLQEIPIDNVESKGNLYVIKESALLVSLVGKKLKPTYFHHDGKNICTDRPSVPAFRVDQSRVDIPYLIHELHSEYVQSQLRQYTSGLIIDRIKPSDFLKIRVKLIPIEEQRAKIIGVQEALYQAKISEARLQAKQFGLENLAYSDVASLKHALGNPLLGLQSGLALLRKAIVNGSQNGLVLGLDSPILPDSRHTIGGTLQSLVDRLASIQEILTHNEKELDLDRYEKQELDLKSFLINFNRGIETENLGKFSSELILDEEINTMLEGKAMVLGNTVLLTIGLDFIVNNAIRHGFTREKSGYRLRLELRINQEEAESMLEIRIGNNGNPFPKGFDKDKLVRKNTFSGDTGNSGIGGYDLNRIIDYHRGIFDLALNDSEGSEWTVTYIIKLPIFENE